jgi:putative PIN family toxin of toxin-antitoxin system
VALVLDTNIVLDLFVFDDPALADLKTAVLASQLPWLATLEMREELRRVLGYPHIAARMVRGGTAAEAVLAAFDDHATIRDVAAKAPVTCKDPDDQKFIDLAVAHRATLLSKDKAVLCMAKRLKVHAVITQCAIDFVA